MDVKSFFTLLIILPGCVFPSYNMRQNDKYGNLASTYADSMGCAHACHQDSLANIYEHKAITYGDSANRYYLLAHPHAFDPVVYKSKCNYK